ncbi:MAG TPA: TolC family protein [Arachidicoccus soli]|nr:TolC family protein [Arachidicoccus soli]
MGRKKLKLVFAFSICFTFLLSMQNSLAQKEGYSLKDALNYGLDHSPYVTISNNQLSEALYDKREAYSPYLPQINGSAEHDYNAKLPITVIPGGFLGPDEIRMKMGLAHSNSATIRLEQKIYDQKAIVGIKAMKDLDKKAKYTSKETMQSFVYNTAMLYYQVLTINQKVKLLEANKEQYSKLVDILKLQLQKGVIKTIDFKRVQVSYNNTTSQLLQIKTAKDVALNQLKVMIGMPMSDSLKLEDNDKQLSSITAPQIEPINISNRTDYQMDQLIYRLQVINTKAIKYAYLPKLSFFAQYGANSYANDFNESFHQFNDFSTIGLKLTVPIFNGLQVNTAYHKQKLLLQNLAAQNKIKTENYKIDFLNAQTKIKSAYSDYQNNKRNLNLAKEVYDVTSLSYQKGASTLSDFLNADFNYKQAQNNYTNAIIQYLSSRLDYEKAKGNLLNYFNIQK